jgi:ketosteroid isomerase-like protein
MTTRYATDEAEIRRRLDELIEAIRATDLEAVMPIYAPDIVSFDIEPPLRHLRAESKRRNWTKVFAMYQRPLGYEVRDLTINVGDDVAFVHCLARLSGTLKGGGSGGYWVRWTPCMRKINGAWRIVHDQVSVPVDFETGKALLNLQP